MFFVMCPILGQSHCLIFSADDEMKNPFSDSSSVLKAADPTAMVIFGASGDLTSRKLIPALYNLEVDGYLPESFRVVGAARTAFSHDAFRDDLKKMVAKFSRRGLDESVWERFSKKVFYQPLDASKAEDFAALKNLLLSLEEQAGERLNYLYYMATAPRFFDQIAGQLKNQEGLVEHPTRGARKTLLIVEKPFGHDLESARELNRELRKYFREEQLFRIDHYLGKETVQNILAFRFANGIFEPLWNRKYVSRIEISVCESVGVGSRAGYFDKSGIVRDIVQNHLFQMLALLCIEPPISLRDADSIRDEKVKVMQAMKRYHHSDVATHVVRGQYSPGFIDGSPVKGYLEEADIAATSMTESYVAMKLEIDNWRWAGVPIYIRAGKRLPKRITELAIYFSQPPASLFKGLPFGSVSENVLAIQVQPTESISLRVNTKTPGPHLNLRPVEMDFTYDDSFGTPSPDAYERLILDAMKDDGTLFTRDDEIEEAWDFLTPVFEAWQGDAPPALYQHAAGSWGPSQADDLIRETAKSWRRL
jgi:glucose-6-phosphate 1-dehydrogenase